MLPDKKARFGMPVAEPVRLGIVGCGGIARRHAAAHSTLEIVEVVAVADVIEENARRIADIAGAKHVLSDYRTLLDRADVDAVLVATPNHLHKEVTVASLEAGKHVLCEKPMALSVADCDEMLAASARANRRLMVGHVMRFLPPFRELRGLLAEGRLGRPLFGVVNRIAHNPVAEPDDPTHWRLSKEKTGGILYEVNIHDLDLLRCVFGEPETVFARSANLHHRRLSYDDTDTVVVGFVGGATGAMHGALGSPIPEVGGIFLCEKGSARYKWGMAGESRLEHQLFEEGASTIVPCGAGIGGGFEIENRMFAEWIRDGRAPEMTAWDGRQAVAMCEAAYESARSGLVVGVK